MVQLTNRVSKISKVSEKVDQRNLLFDLLKRGRLTTDEKVLLSQALSSNKLKDAEIIQEGFELKPRGIDTIKLITPILNLFNMELKGVSHFEGYDILCSSDYPQELLKHQHLIKHYHHLKDIGNALRHLEGKPGTLHPLMLQLYSWNKISANSSSSSSSSVNYPTLELTESHNLTVKKNGKVITLI